MGRDDIKVGIGEFFAMNQSNPNFPPVGGCDYVKAIPYGNGGLIDSDTLFGLARDLPRSPRRLVLSSTEVTLVSCLISLVNFRLQRTLLIPL